jgi:hypothetical protein
MTTGASLAYRWPNGVDQVTVLVGTVIRAKPHDGTLARGGPYLLAASN